MNTDNEKEQKEQEVFSVEELESRFEMEAIFGTVETGGGEACEFSSEESCPKSS